MSTELTIDEAFMPTLPAKKEYRGGYIRVASFVLDGLGISFKDCNTQGKLEDAGVFAEVRKKLLLPENFIVRMILYRLNGYWEVVVESPDLPPVEWHCDVPELMIHYQRLEDRTTRLLKVSIGDKWERTYWKGD